MSRLKRITMITCALICIVICSVAYGQSTRSTLYQGDARVAVQKAKTFEFSLKRGEQLIIEAAGMDDKPISVFKVVDLRDGTVLTELNERKTFESQITIPKDGPYQLHFFNNSSWSEKIFQIRIDIGSPEGAIIASDRVVEWTETRTISPVQKCAGSYSLNQQTGNMSYAFFELKISEQEAGSMFIDVGVQDVAKPWTEHLRSIKNVKTFGTDPLKALQDGEIAPAKLGGADAIGWKLFTVEQWNAFAKGSITENIAGSDDVSAELITVPVSAGTYVLFVSNASTWNNPAIYVEVWTHNIKTTRSLAQ